MKSKLNNHIFRKIKLSVIVFLYYNQTTYIKTNKVKITNEVENEAILYYAPIFYSKRSSYYSVEYL